MDLQRNSGQHKKRATFVFKLDELKAAQRINEQKKVNKLMAVNEQLVWRCLAASGVNIFLSIFFFFIQIHFGVRLNALYAYGMRNVML